MGQMKQLDLDLQGLARVFTHGDGWDLTGSDPGSEAWEQNAESVAEELEKLGWLPPTLTGRSRALIFTALTAEDPAEREDAVIQMSSIFGVDWEA